MAKIAYIDKRFRADRLELIGRVNRVAEEYQAQGYSLTLRQVYYQLVARDIIPNNERSYKNLGQLVSEGRLAGLIDWRAIVDRTRNLRQRSKWSNPSEIIESAARSYHRDWWEGQRYHVEVWVEKDALVDVVGQMCEPLDVPYFSCRGYVSQSELWGAAQRLRRRWRTSCCSGRTGPSTTTPARPARCTGRSSTRWRGSWRRPTAWRCCRDGGSAEAPASRSAWRARWACR